MSFWTSKEPLILITKRFVSLCLQASSTEKMLFNSPYEKKHNKATARHHLESIPLPKQLQIFPIVILLHVPSKTLWIKDGYRASSGIQLNHQPQGRGSQTERKLLPSPLQLPWLSSGGGRKKMEDNSLSPSGRPSLTISNTKLLTQQPPFYLVEAVPPFLISITQYPGSPKLLTGRTKAQTTLQCLVRGRFNTSHVDYPSLTAFHSLTSQAGDVRGNKITQKASLK